MQVNVTFRHDQVTEALRAHVEQKVEKVRKVLIKPLEAQAVLSVDGHRHSAELIVTTRNHTFVVSQTTDDMYKSIDSAADKLERQARRFKERLTSGRRSGNYSTAH